MMSTTGFAPAGYSAIDFGKNAFGALYNFAYHALDTIRTEQIWRVLALLTQHTKAKGSMPRISAVRDAFRSLAQEQGEAAMQSAAFLEMKPGLQHMVLPTTDGSGVRVHNIAITQNPRFGQWLSPQREDTLFTCRGTRAGPFKETLYGKGGRPLPADVNVVLEERVDLDFDMLVGGLRDAGGQSQVDRIGDRIGLRVGGLPEIMVRRKT